MNIFRTELDIVDNPNKIEYGSTILSIGSGFSNTLMAQLKKYKFQVNNNPFGTIYNPISIFNLIDIANENRPFQEHLATETNGIWNHFNFHAHSNASSKSHLQEKLTKLVSDSHDYLKKTDFLFITFGSGYVFKRKGDNHIVANCHRAPTDQFDKVLLTPSEIVSRFKKTYDKLNHIKDIVLIVSPEMHTKDSITLNAVSKSVLRLASHMIIAEFRHVKYFPAYELLLSDLRDYRFYKQDLIHPTNMAMEYIFDKLVDAYVHEDTKNAIKAVEQIINDLNNLPYNPQSEEFQSSLIDAQKKITELESKMDLSEWSEELKAMSIYS